ncbi:hypothetical protein [Peribacillus sp. Hz7]|uniref:hypothetical protein n=1 Tax=Peribacillus sp. Hz7 TaxID=3344873 RepID=UPI0035CB968F
MTDFKKQLPIWYKQGIEPPNSKKTVGWLPNEKPTAEYLNWLQNRTYEALKELQENATHKNQMEIIASQLADMVTNKDTSNQGDVLTSNGNGTSSFKPPTERVGSSPTIKDLNDYSEFKNGDDWIPAFNKAFSDLTSVGGGILQIPVGTFIVRSMITIPSNINVIGGGVGSTIIRLANGINSDIINFDTHVNCGISYLTIQGNVWDPNPMTNKTGVIVGRAGLDLTNGSISNLNIHDISIRDIGGDGFRCYTNTWVYSLSRIRIEFCSGYGAFIESTDNTYTDFYINGIGKTGLYVTGSNNRFSDMKIIFCGRGNKVGGNFIGSGNDFDAGVYVTGKRNQFTNIECQENYGHGFVFDNAIDTGLMGMLSDANGYSMIAKNVSATAVGFYFKGSKRISGDIKSTIFKSTISQLRGYYIDAGCSELSLEYSNDRDQQDINLSASSVITNASSKVATQSTVNYTATRQYSDFLNSGIALNNLITGYNGSNFQLGTDKVTSYTVSGNELQNITTNWSGTAPRLGTAWKPVVQGKTYLVRLQLKPSVNNYFLRVHAFYDQAPYDFVKRTDARYVSSSYTDISFTFTADRNSSNFIVSVWDNIDGNNVTQGSFNVKEVAIVDITDALSQFYLVNTLDKVVKNNYFLSSRTFSSGGNTVPAIETAWEDWTPILTWTTANPTGITTRARRKIAGKTVFFSIQISCTDGNGATGLKINVPSDMLPKQNNLLPPFYNTVITGSSTNVNRQVNLRDDFNQDINFGYLGTATAGQVLKIYFQGFYELQ